MLSHRMHGYSRCQKLLTSHQIFIQTVHCLYVVRLDFESSNLRILNNALLLYTLGQWHVAMLQAPSDQ